MRIIISTIIFFIFNQITYANINAYYFYTDNLNVVKEIDTNAYPIFSNKEQSLLKKYNYSFSIYKVHSEKNLSELRHQHPSIHIEEVQTFTLESLDKEQWYLKNNGETVENWVSDIDIEYIQSKKGEDINFNPQLYSFKEKIRIAIIDSGLDINHPNLANYLVKNEDECQSLEKYKECLNSTTSQNECHHKFANIDANNNGYPLDCTGWSITNSGNPKNDMNGSPDVTDKIGHGTHIAGILAGHKDNFSPIGQNTEILPVQVALRSSTDNPIDNIAKGVLYAIENNVDIINLSLGWRFQFDTKLMRDIIKLAVKKGIFVIVAGGNDSHDDVSFPCAYDDVICVGAYDRTGSLASYSNYGTQIDVLAPGSHILSTWPSYLRSKNYTENNLFEYLSGTNQSAPMISASIANLLSIGIPKNEIRARVLRGARKAPTNSQYRFGNFDFKNAVNLSQSHLLYPINKSPYLVNLDATDKTFRLKIKNYGTKSANAFIDLKSLDDSFQIKTKNFNIENLDVEDVFEKNISININENAPSDIKILLTINQNDDIYEYIIKVSLLRLIHPDIDSLDITHFKLQTKINSNSIIKSFVNISDKSKVDFISISEENNMSTIQILQESQDQYKVSPIYKIKEKDITPLSFYKVDLDHDHHDDYVMVYIFSDEKGIKHTKFYVIDHQLNQKRYLISPENKFSNDKTFIPGKLNWIKLQNRTVPTWIGHGLNADNISISPWRAMPNLVTNYIYYLNEDGLHHFNTLENHFPLHIIPTPKLKLKFISSYGFEYVKKYFYNSYEENKLRVDELSLPFYFDFFQTRPLQYSNRTIGLFFHDYLINGSQLLGEIILRDEKVEVFIEDIQNINKNESIIYINQIFGQNIFYQTETSIGYLDKETGKRQSLNSKVKADRRRYLALSSRPGVFLPSTESPSYISETLVVNNSGTLISDRRLKSMAINGCEDINIVERNKKEFIAYSCLSASKILFLSIEQ